MWMDKERYYFFRDLHLFWYYCATLISSVIYLQRYCSLSFSFNYQVKSQILRNDEDRKREKGKEIIVLAIADNEKFNRLTGINIA